MKIKLLGYSDSAATLAGYGIEDAYTDVEVDNLLAAKADTETGSGTLSPTSTTYDGSAGTFIYAKSGNIVTVTLHMSAFTEGGNYVAMSGLPYKAAAAVAKTYASAMVRSSAGVNVNVRIDGNWVYFSSVGSNFAGSETLTVTLTYIVSS